MKIKSSPFKNKIVEICGIAAISALFAGAFISNFGFSSTNVLAQGSQNATQPQQQQQDAISKILNFTQNLRTLEQESGLNTTASSPETLREAVQNFMNGSSSGQFSERLSQFAQQSGLNSTRLEQASPDIMSRLQNFTEMIQSQRAGSNMTGSE